jgi:hypothetical protein
VGGGVDENWVDLEELYRWLQELEETKVPATTQVQRQRQQRHSACNCSNFSFSDEDNNSGNLITQMSNLNHKSHHK